MHLASLPKNFRGDPSPVIAIDSPFPPLKAEPRYRGVYERAGFDVNLGRNSDGRSLRSKKSPVSPAVSGKKFFFPKSVFAETSKRGSSSESPASPSVRSSNDSKENVFPFSKAQPGYTSHFNSSECNSGNSSQLASSHTSTRSTSSRPYIQQFQPEQKYSRPHNAIQQPAVDGFDRNRNKKQLKLFIPESESTLLTKTSSDGLERISSFDREVASMHSTPSTSSGSSPSTSDNTANSIHLESSSASVKTPEPSSRTPYPVYNSIENTGHDLESSLADLKRERISFDPRGTPFNTSINRAKPAIGAFVPATGDLSESFNKTDSQNPVGLPSDDSSFFFDSARYSADTIAPHNDYDEFLQISHMKKGARNSQFSTISSIISKQRKSSIRVDGSDGEIDSDDDFDDEVALELQRQLDQIKTGSQSSSASSNFVHSEDSFVTANKVCLLQKENAIPTFKLSNETDGNSGESESEEEAEFNETTDTSANEDAFSQEIKPLSYNRRSSFYAGDLHRELVSTPFSEPDTPSFKQTEFENHLVCETPETIKPLSPKSHSVERELERLNFKCSQQDESQDSITSTVVSDQSDIDVLGKNPTPPEFDAFPKSVVNPGFPSFRFSEGVGKAPPGTGPCRACGAAIDSESKGSQKAIYSKSGDLSGQWHRSCFKCSYAGCSIQFNKQITPYVLLDNAFCNHHYHTLNNTLCETCHTGIEGECIENELKQKWHLSCLKCTKCSEVISNDYFLVNHQIVCEADASSFITDLRKSGLTTSEKIEKRRTRMLFIS